LKSLLVFTGVPLAVWFVAFLLWFFWYDIVGLVSRDERQPKSVLNSGGGTPAKVKPPLVTPPEEKILNEDRKRLKDIINKRR